MRTLLAAVVQARSFAHERMLSVKLLIYSLMTRRLRRHQEYIDCYLIVKQPQWCRLKHHRLLRCSRYHYARRGRLWRCCRVPLLPPLPRLLQQLPSQSPQSGTPAMPERLKTQLVTFQEQRQQPDMPRIAPMTHMMPLIGDGATAKTLPAHCNHTWPKQQSTTNHVYGQCALKWTVLNHHVLAHGPKARQANWVGMAAVKRTFLSSAD
jgi:hypothetical protein